MRFSALLSVVLALAFAGERLSLSQESPEAIIPLSEATRAQCVATLRTVFQGDDFWPAMHAAEALTLAGLGDSVVAELEARLQEESDDQRRCGLAREIVRSGPRLPLQQLWKILADPASAGRGHAAESLYKIAEVGDGRLLRAAFAQHDDPRLKLMAAAALGRAGNRDALQALRDHRNANDRELRKVAVWVLGLLGDSQDVGPLKQALADETDPLARAYIVNALACLGDGDARRALGQNLSASDPAIRTYAAEFAGYARCFELRPRLVEMLNDPHPDAGVRAAQSLIAMSLPASALGLPVANDVADVRRDVYPATEKFPRYSEGSIVALRDGSLLFATTEFEGGGQDHATATIVARTSHDGGRTWGPQRTLQENVGRQNVMSVTLRRLGTSGEASPLGMFFLVKNGPTDLKVYLRTSHDEGQTFGEPVTVTPGAGYYVMNNDRVTLTHAGRLICPVAWTENVSAGGHFVSLCYFSDDGGATWRECADRIDQPRRGAMEPEVVELADGTLLMIIRTQLGYIATSRSEDGGDHWSAPQKLPLPAPEAPATLRTIPATGDLLLIWNQTYQPGAGHGGKRTPLTAAISRDGGATWGLTRNLEDDPHAEYAYTSILFHKDRLLLSYYVRDEGSGRIASRFRSLPVRQLYATP